jgi:hypothetical protein
VIEVNPKMSAATAIAAGIPASVAAKTMAAKVRPSMPSFMAVHYAGVAFGTGNAAYLD